MNVNVCARHLLTALGFVVALLAPARVAAQGEATIAGTVTDSSTRTPVPGVQITIAGTARGTLTDDGGRYALRGVPAGTVSLRVQRLGYAPVERSVAVSAGQTADVDFVLTPVARVLTEVVATGYGTSIRRELSSSVSSLQAAEVQNAAVAGVDAALQGKAPGVQVIQNSGNPGVGITVRVRGASSISASNQPLWVIDGVPMIREDFSQIAVGGQDITAVTGISPDEIESIDILKDAASAAIYGSRAANGVVMIRTKRGRAGAPRFSFNLYTGIQETAKKLELLNSREFVEFANEAFSNDGYAPEDLPFIAGEDDVINTDWQDAVLRTAPVNDVSLSVDGGNERIRYLVGGSYFDQRGIVIGSGYDRQTIRANLDFDPTNRLSFRSSLALSRELHERIENDNTIEGVYANAIANLPMFPVRQPDGRYTNTNDVVGQYDDVPLTYINPVAVADLSFNESRSLRSYGTIEGSFRINDSFRLNSRAGFDVLNLRDLTWESPNVIGSLGESVRGRAVQANNTATRYMLESYLGYDYTGGFSLNLTGGASVEWNNAENDFLRGEGFAHTAFQYPGNAGRVTTYDGDRTGHNLVSFFGRVNATFADRYLFSGSIRADGSSRFGAENRYG
ncbi:MAG TPA: SusC/RagA family TonB-linked outer membrane protein, partial [Gemmatimonadaceae bacterium]|nr:SusC/RagA family TonB-linked outer membrane protein [Gemmatimonadaceae bacterium]